MQPLLRYLDANGHLVQLPLSNQTLLLGRDPPADVQLPHPAISRRHAEIRCENNTYFFADLGSRNGSYINGVAADRTPRRLNDGDTIVLGGAISISFHDPTATVEVPRLGSLRGVWIDDAAGHVWVDGQLVDPPLSVAQLALLRLLASRLDSIVSREEIIAAVWPNENPDGISGEALDGLIKRTRARLRQTQPAHEYLAVIRGHGLRLRSPDA